ncbi:hypothetical protein [uncultured Clostridium sp.]|uniref:hypothetical protein n=1 Tax=uncultured Clostridium sp. TaxID=59620 RepID=UPI0025FD409F|nr:hypothetical protein [uncultured Clostridium sp.]
MNVIAVYVMTKEKLAKKIADKVVEFYMSGMSYEEALKKAKEIYIGFDCKKHD